MAIQPNVTQFIADFNKYYETNRFSIMANLFYGMFDPSNPYTLTDRCQMMDGINKPQLIQHLNINNVIQRANSRAFNEKGDLEFAGRTLTPMGWKYDLRIDFQGMWKEYLMTQNVQRMGLVPTESNILPEVMDLFLKQILGRASADLREAIFKGVYVNSSSDYSHLSWMNGFTKLLKDAVTATDLTPTVAAVTSAADVLPKIKTLTQALGDIYRNSPTAIVLVATDVWYKACDVASGFGTTAPTIVINNGNREDIANNILLKPLPFAPNIKLMEEPTLPTGGMLATVKENLVVGFDSYDASAQIRVREDDRLLKVLGDGLLGVQVARVKPVSGIAPIVVNEALVA